MSSLPLTIREISPQGTIGTLQTEETAFIPLTTNASPEMP